VTRRNVFITGGTGYIGRNLILELLARRPTA
jgi:thioester reductase-like protein